MEKKSCAERIQKAMELRNLKQVDLINMTGIKKSALSQYVSGKILPRQNNIYKLAKALNVNEAWLMGYDVDINRVSNISEDERVTKLPLHERLQLEELLKQNAMFFNDESVSDEDKEKFFNALQETFFEIKFLKQQEKKNKK